MVDFAPENEKRAAKAALDEYEDPIELSLVGNALSGYMRQCKVVSDFKVEPTKDGEKINFKLSWAGKARLAKDIERRANDKFNTARAFKKEVRCGRFETGLGFRFSVSRRVGQRRETEGRQSDPEDAI